MSELHESDAVSPAPGPDGTAGATTNPAPPPPAPFAGVPLSDFVLDGLAAVLLVVSLVLPWSQTRMATDHVDVILVTVLSVLSIALHYLSRVGALPGWLPPARVPLVRLLANAPYLVLAAVYLVLGITRGLLDDGGGSDRGIGAALVIGLAGAVLAAVPRRAELEPRTVARVGRLWQLALVALAAVVGVGALVSFVDLAKEAGHVESPVLFVLGLVLTVALWAWVAIRPALGILRGRIEWAWILLAAGASVGAWELFRQSAAVPGVFPAVPALHPAGLAIILLPTIAVIAVSPAVLDVLSERRSSESWFATVTAGLQYLAVAAAITAGLLLVELLRTTGGGVSSGTLVALLLLTLVAVVAAVVGRSAFVTHPSTGRVVVLGAIAVVFLLGLVGMIIRGENDFLTVDPDVILVSIGLPVLIALALTVPASVRQYFAQAPELRRGPTRVAAPAPTRATAAMPVQRADPIVEPILAPTPTPAPAPTPTPTPEPTPAPTPEPTPTEAAEPPVEAVATAGTAATAAGGPETVVIPVYTQDVASDPATDQTMLAAIAADAPHLRVFVAGNPSAYPGLLEWLGQLGDPEVDAALAARRR